MSQSNPMIRVIGDPILHQPGCLFPNEPEGHERQALIKQIAVAKEVLVQTGGAGIAANQCLEIEKPYCFAIVGIFYNISEHVSKVRNRYPNTRFPEAAIMVNPTVLAVSLEKQLFNHGCLSVPCGNRCAVKSPMEIQVTYQDPMANLSTKVLNCKGISAVLLWHELKHILDGQTYMDVTFDAFSAQDLLSFKENLVVELQKRVANPNKHIPNLKVPPFYLTVQMTDSGFLQLDLKTLKKALSNMTDETLGGLLKRIFFVASKKGWDI